MRLCACAQLLPRLIGSQRALEMSLGAAPVDAARAERWGLVSRVCAEADVLDEGRALAGRILANWAPMVRNYKAASRDGAALPLGSALALERERAAEYYRGMREGDWARLASFLAEKKKQKQEAKERSRL